MMRVLIPIALASAIFPVTQVGAAPAAAPVTAEQFIGRCKSDARFCRIQIMAVETAMEKSRKACLPASVTKDAMAARVQDMQSNVYRHETGPALRNRRAASACPPAATLTASGRHDHPVRK